MTIITQQQFTAFVSAIRDALVHAEHEADAAVSTLTPALHRAGRGERPQPGSFDDACTGLRIAARASYLETLLAYFRFLRDSDSLGEAFSNHAYIQHSLNLQILVCGKPIMDAAARSVIGAAEDGAKLGPISIAECESLSQELLGFLEGRDIAREAARIHLGVSV